MAENHTLCISSLIFLLFKIFCSSSLSLTLLYLGEISGLVVLLQANEKPPDAGAAPLLDDVHRQVYS